MSITTNPEPFYTMTPDTDRGMYSDKRTYSYRWLSSVTQETVGDENGVELSISHDKDRKRIDVRVTPVRLTGRSVGFTIGNGGGPMLVKSIPTARYSRKALDAAASEALAAFPANIPAGTLAAVIWSTIVNDQAAA